MDKTDILYICPWCHSSLPERFHVINKVLGMWSVGCPKYSKDTPTFLNQDLYKIHPIFKISL